MIDDGVGGSNGGASESAVNSSVLTSQERFMNSSTNAVNMSGSASFLVSPTLPLAKFCFCHVFFFSFLFSPAHQRCSIALPDLLVTCKLVTVRSFLAVRGLQRPGALEILAMREFISPLTLCLSTLLSLSLCLKTINRSKENWPQNCYLKYNSGYQFEGTIDVHIICPVGLMPRETADFAIRVRAPEEPGEYKSYFRLHTPDGFVTHTVFSGGMRRSSFCFSTVVSLAADNAFESLPRIRRQFLRLWPPPLCLPHHRQRHRHRQGHRKNNL